MSHTPLSEMKPFRVAGHSVDPAGLRVSVGGDEARLEARVMQVLVYLAKHAGRVVSRRELEEQVWSGRIVTEDSVTKAIAKLRRVFRDDAHAPAIVETVPKSGYRLIAEVMLLDEARTAQDGAIREAPAVSARRKRAAMPAWLVGALSLLTLVAGLWIMLAWDRMHSAFWEPREARPAVAILPFGNLGRVPEDDYFANGITADLITDLSKLSGLLVIAPGTVFAYRNSGAAPGEISAELDVDYLVTGTVQRLRDRLRINVQLIDAGGGRALWGERYSGRLSELFEIQDALTASVIAALQVELVPAELRQVATSSTASVAAYDAYLRGLEEHGGRSEVQNRAARHHFEEAIALDPGFARAYAGLALTYSREAIDGWTSAPASSLRLAAQFADKAARMDPSLPQVHFVTGQVRLFQRRHTAAIEAAERATAVDPNYADAYALLAWSLNYAGRPRKALASLEQAMRLNPRPPASYLEILGEIQFAQGRYQDSASTFQRVLGINPSYLRARMWNAAALVEAGSEGLAEWEVDELMIASPHLTLKRLEFAFPFKDPRTSDRALNALRTAGVGED